MGEARYKFLLKQGDMSTKCAKEFWMRIDVELTRVSIWENLSLGMPHLHIMVL